MQWVELAAPIAAVQMEQTEQQTQEMVGLAVVVMLVAVLLVVGLAVPELLF
jgi:hypothetical protein